MIECPFAHQLPGPPGKVYSSTPTHRKTGACLHEAEYDLPEDNKVLYNVLFSTRQASWHFTITREGWLFQHYPLDATCWHCGWPGNLWLIGIELETTKNRKLTEPQYKVLVRLLKWLRQELEWPTWDVGYYGLPHKEATLWEHNEAQWPYTDCQVFSQRIVDSALLIYDMEWKEDGMTDEQVKQTIKELLGFGPDTPDKDVIGEMKKVRFQGLVVTEAVGLALVGKDWKRVREIMDFFNLGR